METFDCNVPDGLIFPATAWPGRDALVVCGESKARSARLMHWGLPATEAGRTSFHWAERNFFSRLAFHEKAEPAGRCLIPLDSFALPDGDRGRRTRSWFGLWDEPLFAWGGLWRPGPDGEPAFVGAMVNANGVVARVSEMMPVILPRFEQQAWLSGELTDVMRLWRQRPSEDALWLERTDELWVSGEAVHELEAARKAEDD